MLLAPTVNLHRHPLWGRNFECFSEDPVLTGKLAIAFIDGVQATTSWRRSSTSSATRSNTSATLPRRRSTSGPCRELYLLPFEYGVRNAGVLALMTSYNRVNGQFVTERRPPSRQHPPQGMGIRRIRHDRLERHRDDRRSSQGGPRPGDACAGAGFGPALAEAVRSGQLDETQLDKMVHRMLTVFDRVGALDDVPVDEHPKDREEDRAFVRRAAGDGMVLLANDGLLPLEASALHRIAVVGPNAERLAIMGGGSARVTPHYALSPLACCASGWGTRPRSLTRPASPATATRDEASIQAAVSASRRPMQSSSSSAPTRCGRAKATTASPWGSHGIRTSS